MIGTIINVSTVLVGGSLGLRFGARMPERTRQSVVAGLGLFTAAYGIYLFTKTESPIILLISLLIGGIIGEWVRIEDGLNNLGKVLESNFSRLFSGTKITSTSDNLEFGDDQNLEKNGQVITSEPREGKRFIRGFLTASLVYCVGPMAILGSIQDGLTGDFNTLAIKSIMDGFASLAFASSLGVGVLFSALVILAYQGSITLLAAQAQAWISTEMMAEITAVGGVLLLGIAISSLLEIKPLRVGNFLPALAIAPILVAIFSRLGLG
ncbi:MAG: DUF554 domain-containing protein [Anaerolineales bacterium]|nr:DUF554 domain-containing protein [Anaerolineales bacterium]